MRDHTAARVYAESWGENDLGRVADKSANLYAFGGWGLQVDDQVGVGARFRSLHFEHGFSGGYGQWETPTDSMTLGAWRHVAVVYDASSTANDPAMYIDGVRQSVARDVAPAGAASDDAAQTLTIGNVSTSRDRTFDGMLDELRLERTARSDEWILVQYLSGRDQLVTFGDEEPAPP